MKAQQPDFRGVSETVVLITSLIEVRDLAFRTFNRDQGKERSYSDFHTNGELTEMTLRKIFKNA